MNTSDHIWEWVDQPPDDKLLQVCMHEWKYHLILKGLTLLLNEVEKLHRHTSSLGFHQAFYKEEIDRIKQIIEWDNSHPKQRFGLYEERLSIQTLRYFKAGLLLLVSAEEEKRRVIFPLGPWCH